ncbi:MAG TPA: DNA primase [Bacillus bacterium]|uniref:DNA primase n=1 Tax=Siminovitchia fordii TaxID=254759 RepID=A0ABQ4K2M5_9BACI|nr:DNA primase [Siminovitchia fordii]GIN20019.1 DNA primase [Siminovitchia fordii]HBZ09041.1 DNA primase [Bacillus sp. (in: firmicutes)]
MAARIPEEKISELRQSVDIVDIISEYVQLKKQGRNYFGLCPFHNENTPSFSVAPEKQIFHCFGCGAGGNVFNFLMDAEGVTFQEAAAIIADKGGIPLQIEQPDSQRDDGYPSEHQIMIDAHELLGKLYHHLLLNTKEGAGALDYLLSRGFSPEGIRKFKIGYSLPEWDMAVKYLTKRGFKEEELENAGLIIKKENDDGFFDRFRNRIMFPLFDTKGRTIAFSARALESDDSPKYLNTPETAIFNKSSLLYNYHEARSEIRRQGYAVLFEGFADVISADQANVKNGVAVMGTSLTNEHIQLLRRLTDTIILCFDSDQAGIEASNRAGSMLVEKGLEVKAALLPKGMDPDDYIRKHGTEKFRTDVIGNSLAWTAFKLHYYRFGKNLKNEGEKLKYIEEVMNELSKLDNPIERDLYIRQIAEEFSLSLEVLEDQQKKLVQAEGKKQQQQKQAGSFTQLPQKRQKVMPAHITAERLLLARMIRDEEATYRIMTMLEDQTFYYDEHQAIITYLLGYYAAGNPPDPLLFLDHLPDKKLRAIVTEIEMMSVDSEDNEQELKDCVNYVLNHAKMLMIKEKQSEQREAERSNNVQKALEIAQEIISLRKSLSI